VKISYSILTHNEDESLQRLLEFLVKHKDEEDEIVILDDYSDNPKTIEILDIMTSMHEMTFEQRHLLKDYAGQKNFLTRMCKNDYIVNIDADEIPHKSLMKNLKPIFASNPTIDLYWVPRVNTVDGITEEHMKAWRWRATEQGWINYPDFQSRIFRNSPDIRWKRPVHEMIEGCKTYAHLPPHEELSLYHPKTIKKQEEQNNFYSTL